MLADNKSSDETLGSGAVADIFPIADGIHVSLGFNGIFTSKGLYFFTLFSRVPRIRLMEVYFIKEIRY